MSGSDVSREDWEARYHEMAARAQQYRWERDALRTGARRATFSGMTEGNARHIEHWEDTTIYVCGDCSAVSLVPELCLKCREPLTAVEVVPLEQLEGAVEAGNALYALLDRPDDYDRAAVESAMEAWLAATLDQSRGR